MTFEKITLDSVSFGLEWIFGFLANISIGSVSALKTDYVRTPENIEIRVEKNF